MSIMDNFRKNNAWGGEQTPDEARDMPRMITVDIHEIDTSHVNPRKTVGENYESTKASIKNIGLQTVLTITRIPGNDRYSLYNGGNTRLSILKELYEEYRSEGEDDKAEALRYQDCRYVPWTDDLDSLVKQMAENEERSPMTFIDKARAIFQIREIYLAQHQVEEVSNRELVKYIHNLGWTSINQPSMTEFAFAFDELESVLPLSLDAGMGKPKVQQLRKRLSLVESYIAHLNEKEGCSYPQSRARELYFATLAERDSDINPLDVPDFFEDYEYALAEELRVHDPDMTSMRINFALSQIDEYGAIPEPVPTEELYRQLRETSTVPETVFPNPRKPRTPKPKGDGEMECSDTDEPSGIDKDEFNQFETQESAAAEQIAKSQLSPSKTVGKNFNDLVEEARKAKYVNDYWMQRHPPYELPDNRLPPERYYAELIKHSTAVLNELYPPLITDPALRELLIYGEGYPEVPVTRTAPYLFVNLTTDETYQRLRKALLEDEAAVQYALLYAVYLQRFYFSYIYPYSAMEPPMPLLEQQMIRIWDEFGSLWDKYSMLCLSGRLFVYTAIPDEQAARLIYADQRIQYHLGICYASEYYLYKHPSQDGRAGGHERT